ncbi:hypothetical protein [Phytohabitans houttuyneae]|uniref:Uncharacterized protein n=1 Tax=Phytohabitans houttuyneae TaxID=1076126 RepID=A0A6V8KEE7_9ACTN|nr:hypothetical protein [Phytohabitans houttuyneae]GFJ82194.1 hypothetical protein Phou_063740 [Phytohabitans houttuyneae]
MRTEEDLRAALVEREVLAPDRDRVLERARRTAVRRRRRHTAGAAAATAAVMAAGLPVAVHQWSGGPDRQDPVRTVTAPVAGTAATPSSAPVPSGPRPPFAFTLRPGPIAGFTLQPMGVNADVQIAAIRPAGEGPARAQLFVHRADTKSRAAWDVSDSPARVRVNGKPAWYSVKGAASAIRWEHAPGGWAVIETSGPPLPQQTLVSLAEAVRFTAPYEVTVPYRLSYLPAGYRPFHVVQASPAALSVVQLERDGGAMDITVLDGPPSGRPGWRPDRTIAGRPAQCTDLVDGRRCAVDFGTFTVDVGSGTVSRAEMARVVAGMSFADVRDPATWHELDAALPAR